MRRARVRTSGERASVLALLVAATLAWDAAFAHGRLAAQAGEEMAEEAPRICFRGRPLPACQSFWIVEVQAYTPLTQSSRPVRYSDGPPILLQSFEDQLEWNVGHMINVNPSLALGGLFTIGTGAGEGVFAGLKGRVRRWVGPQVSVEVEGGWLRSGVVYPTASGVTADVRLNIRDHGSFFVRWDGVDLPPQSLDYGGGYGYDDAGGFQQALSVGAGLGSTPALVGTGALALVYVIWLGIFLSGDPS